MRIARIAPVAIAVIAAVALGACAPAAPNAGPDKAAVPPSHTDRASPTVWPAVRESGTGPTTFTVPNPSAEALYLHSEFTCTSGDFELVLVENPNVSTAGTCGGAGGYQMTLPTDEDRYTITVDVDPGASFTFTGRYSTG